MKTIKKWTMIFLSIIITMQISAQDRLPDGWFSTDIGTVNLPSRVNYDAENGSFEVRAAGNEYWGSGGDHGHLIYFETENDDEVIVRIFDLENFTRNGKVLIDLRTSLDYRASNLVLELKINRDHNPYIYSVVFYYRPEDRAGSTGDTEVRLAQSENPVPRWLRLARQGSFVSAFHAEDKENFEDLVWHQVGTPVRLAFRGPAYMGIAVCGGEGGRTYTTAWFDNLRVQEVSSPYRVTRQIATQNRNVGSTIDINVTDVFGHYIGDYWRITPVSSDPNIVNATFWEQEFPNEDDRPAGERFVKYIRVNALSHGIATVRLTTNIMGHEMETDFMVVVTDPEMPPERIVDHKDPPAGWEFEQFHFPRFKGPHVVNGNVNEPPFVLDARFFNRGGVNVAHNRTGATDNADILNYNWIGRTPYEGVRIGSTGVDRNNPRWDGPTVDRDGLPNGNIGNSGSGGTANQAGNWLAYTIEVPPGHEGVYKVEPSIAANDATIRYYLMVNGVRESDTIAITRWAETNRWTSFAFVPDRDLYTDPDDPLNPIVVPEPAMISLEEGIHEIRFFFVTGGFDLRSLRFTKVEDLDPDRPEPERLSVLDYDNGTLNERIQIVSNRQAINLADASIFLNRHVNIHDKLEMKVYVESVANTGPGSFAGLLLRLDDPNSTEPPPFVSFEVGAYQGLRLSYRWEDNAEIITRTIPDVLSPVWLIMRKSIDNSGTQQITLHYSYDNQNWQDLLSFPLKVDFFDTGSIQAGLALSGGTLTSFTRQAGAVFKGFEFKVNQEFEELETVQDITDLITPLIMSPNSVLQGTSATISYGVVMEGPVSMLVFDSVGRLVATLVNTHMQPGEYQLTYTPNLPPGQYLLRFRATQVDQFIRFVIQ